MRFHGAAQLGDEEVVVWGNGSIMREFLHVDDMAAASVDVMELDRSINAENTELMLNHINIGTGADCTIREMVETVAKVTNFKDKIVWDTTKADGAPKKLMDESRLHVLGWKHSFPLEESVQNVFSWFINSQDNFRS